MGAKTERAEFRVDDALRAKMQRAAELVHEQQSEFIRRAVFERAERILAQELITVMSAEQFDALLDSLDEADAAPALAELARRPRVFKRR
ncbi:DUF1778 domain-containing protein [Nocardia sp. NPDC058666]|uniref:type II toxin-antitoxin system TacA family antitoxin n=1 Tax=unclassified Nocardia TaxID=2637762 RepID=UPI00366691AB